MKDKKEKIKKETKSKAVDVNITPSKKIKDKIEDKPEIDVHPRCTMELIKNEETNTLDVVYSKGCSGGTVREIAGILALDGVRFKPESEEKSEEKTPEEKVLPPINES